MSEKKPDWYSLSVPVGHLVNQWADRNDLIAFLGPNRDADDFEMVTDILDVWFDSGCSHLAVMKRREELTWPGGGAGY